MRECCLTSLNWRTEAREGIDDVTGLLEGDLYELGADRLG